MAFVEGPAGASLPRPAPTHAVVPSRGCRGGRQAGHRRVSGWRRPRCSGFSRLLTAGRDGRILVLASRPLCRAGAEAVLGGDAPGSGRVPRGARSLRPSWAAPAPDRLSGPDHGQQQKRPAGPTAGCACPQGHPGPRRKLMARPDEDSLGTVHKVWAGAGKPQRLSPASPTPGQTAGEGAFTGLDRCGELESPPGEGSPFLSTA